MQPTKKYMRGENMRVLLLLRGSAGCGKSTWIEQNGLKQYALSADDIRMMCSSPQMMPDGTHAISQANDNIVWKTLFNILETRMKNGEFTVIDATNSKTYLRNQYLMKNRYGMYLNLLTAGTLNQHLLQTEEEAQMRMETLIQQMAEKEGVTEELKARDQMEWIGRMNNIRQRAQEIVRNEILEN